jgi:hypothetical protein
MILRGSLIFGREAGAPNEQKAFYYHQALVAYQDPAALALRKNLAVYLLSRRKRAALLYRTSRFCREDSAGSF